MTKSNIATAINAAHEKAANARKEAVAAATECGRLLIEAKATVKHGGWDDWLREHCSFSARTAQLYMKLARYLEDGDPAKAQRVADLSLRDAAQAIADPRPIADRHDLTREEEKDVTAVMAHWLIAPVAMKERFVRTIHQQGDIDAEERDRMLVAAQRWTPEASARRAAEMLAQYLPADQLVRVVDLVRRNKLTGPDLTRAMDDLERAGLAPERT